MLRRMCGSLNVFWSPRCMPHPLPYAPLTLDQLKFPINPCIVHIQLPLTYASFFRVSAQVFFRCL